MYKKIIITFLVSLCLFFLLCQAFFQRIKERQERRDARQTSIILENVKDRFKNFLDLPLTIGIIGGEFLQQNGSIAKDYRILFDKILSLNIDILGLNLTDENGKIIRVTPAEKNPGTEGKVTQNIQALRQSLQRGEHFWLSSPFKLYQGQQGFALYVPVFKDSVLKGWLATVISAEGFMEKFRTQQLLKDYDIIIKDQETGIPYFSTGISSDVESKIYESYSSLHGRHLIFESWRKEEAAHYPYDWTWSLALALILAGACAYTMKLYEQKKFVRHQLDDVSTLLGLTAKDAINNLIEEQTKNSGSVNHISYLTNLVEQIDLLQTMAHTKTGPDVSHVPLLPLLKKQLENFEEIILRKDLLLIYNEGELSKVNVTTNEILFQNSVLANALAHAIIHALPGSRISIKTESTESKNYLHIGPQKISPENPESILFDRRMDVAKKVLHIYNGELYMQKDAHEGMIISIVLPR